MIGINLRALYTEEKKKLGLQHGFKVVGPVMHELLKDTNICEGFIILSIDGERPMDLDSFMDMLNKDQGVLIKGMYPDGTFDHYYTEGLKPSQIHFLT